MGRKRFIEYRAPTGPTEVQIRENRAAHKGKIGPKIRLYMGPYLGPYRAHIGPYSDPWVPGREPLSFVMGPGSSSVVLGLGSRAGTLSFVVRSGPPEFCGGPVGFSARRASCLRPSRGHYRAQRIFRKK